VGQYYDMTTRTHLPLDSVDLKTLDSAVTEESRIVTSTSAAEPKRVRAVADKTEVSSIFGYRGTEKVQCSSVCL
jgi:hypothetical protein